MQTYERSVRVDAPFEAVWDFHSRASGLAALTPDWLDLRVDGLRGPDGTRLPDDAVLEAGAEIGLSVAPFGLGPRQHWTSRITERQEDPGTASFRDEMVAGPFPSWQHTHLFSRDGDGTLVRDVVRYELPGADLGRRLGPLAGLGFEPVFAYRHCRTRELLESDGLARADV